MSEKVDFKQALKIYNSHHHFKLLTDNKQNALLDWIKKNLIPFKVNSFNEIHSSSTLANIYQKRESTGVENGEMKGALLKLGFKVKDKSAINWIVNISKELKF